MKKFMIAVSILVALILPRPARAQALGIDGVVHSLPTAGEQKAADIASWVTVGTNVALDLNATIGKCRGEEDCYNALMFAGIRYGVTFGATQLLKVIVHRERPCFPFCGIDNPNRSFPSGHTAFAFAALGGPRLEFALPLAVSTGGLRIAADKHWLTDTLAGAAIGLATSRIR